MGGPGFWLMVALAAFVLALALAPVSYRVTNAAHLVADRIREQLAMDADTFGEPTREQVEAEYLDLGTILDDADALDSVEISDEARLFGDAGAYFDSLRFEAEVLADIDDLPITWTFQ